MKRSLRLFEMTSEAARAGTVVSDIFIDSNEVARRMERALNVDHALFPIPDSLAMLPDEGSEAIVV